MMTPAARAQLAETIEADPVVAYGRVLRPDWSVHLRDEVPEHIWREIVGYVLLGTPPGGFVEAVLQDSLIGAAMASDAVTRPKLWEIARFVAMGMPHDAQGSQRKVFAWIARGGLAGHRDADIDDEDADVIEELPS